MSRHDFRRPIADHISNIRSELAKVPAEKRLHVIAEALYDMNPTGADEVLRVLDVNYLGRYASTTLAAFELFLS